MRVFFGHQSVGQNVVDGLAELGGGLRVVDLDGASGADDATPALLHARIGANGDPRGKIDDFARRAAELHAAGVDTVMMKLCYADIGATTDTDGLLGHYARAVSHLRAHCPDLRVVHVTTPLRRMPLGARALARRALRRPEDGLRANAARAAYNAGLAARFGDDPLFDLAAAESGRPGGRTAGRRHAGRVVPSLAPEYTDDGGHLNARGRAVVARALARFLHDLDGRRQRMEQYP